MVDLVTGGSGFIGRHLVNLLLSRNRDVRVIDVLPFKNKPPGVEFIQGSVNETAVLRDAMHGVENLYHLAGNPNLWAPDRDEFHKTNYLGTLTVLEVACKCKPRRIIYTSTESILLACRQSRLRGYVDESVQGHPDEMPGTYCRSKFMAEAAALSAANDGLPVIIVNPTLPVGPGDWLLTPPTRMLLNFVNGKYPAYLDCTLNMIDVQDVALGHLLAAESGIPGKRYILGNENLRLATILGMIEKITGAKMPGLRIPYHFALMVSAIDELLSALITRKPPAAPLTGVRLAKYHLQFDNSKTRQELGLETRPVYQALEAAISWMVAEGLVRRPLPAFSNKMYVPLVPVDSGKF
jgi:dihydroflavonol-4-reductase